TAGGGGRAARAGCGSVDGGGRRGAGGGDVVASAERGAARCRRGARRPARAADDDRGEDLRVALGRGRGGGRVRRAVGAAGRQRVRADGHPVLARVRVADGGDLLRGEA